MLERLSAYLYFSLSILVLKKVRGVRFEVLIAVDMNEKYHLSCGALSQEFTNILEGGIAYIFRV
jgi:hypothetical protein